MGNNFWTQKNYFLLYRKLVHDEKEHSDWFPEWSPKREDEHTGKLVSNLSPRSKAEGRRGRRGLETTLRKARKGVHRLMKFLGIIY